MRVMPRKGKSEGLRFPSACPLTGGKVENEKTEAVRGTRHPSGEGHKAHQDAELRRVAFERVLDDLLSGGGTGTQSGAHAPKHVERSTRMAGKPRKSSGPKGYVRELIDDGFFKKPKTIQRPPANYSSLYGRPGDWPTRLRGKTMASSP
jgi:hypothetical protein